MKLLPLLVTVLGLCLTVLPAPRAQAETEVTFDYFYDALAPYGTWVEVEGYGTCWSPSDVDPDWAPYTEGEWVYTDGGWTWLGDEPFAGIVYHYGRWILAGSQGWCWVPGYEWAPAWVAWRDSEEYIGWAPLPPEVVWEPDQGVGVWVDEVYGIGPSFYNFCHHRDFGEHRLRSVLLARSWNTAILVQTVNITNLCYNRSDRVVFCGGPSYERACRFTARPITTLRLDRRDDFNLRDGRQPLPGGHIAGNTLAVVAPRVRPSPEKTAHFPKAARVIGHSQVSLGWVGRGASGDLDSVRRKIREEVDGRTPKTAPARRVDEKELAVIPSRSGSPKAAPAPQVAAPPAASSPIPQQPVFRPEQRPVVHPPASGGVVSTTPEQSGFQPPAGTPRNEMRATNGGAHERQVAPAPLSSNAFTRQQQQQQLQAAAHAEVERRQAQESLARQQAETMRAQTLQRGREALESQRQEQSRMQVQAQARAQAEAAARQQEQWRAQQQQQQALAQRQQQAAAAAAREQQIRAEQQQRRAAMQASPPPAPVVRQAPASTPPASSSSSSSTRSDDRDDRHKKR